MFYYVAGCWEAKAGTYICDMMKVSRARFKYSLDLSSSTTRN